MDDEAKQLLREMRDLLAKADVRDAEWTAEMREKYDKANAEKLKITRWNICTVWFLLGALGAVSVALLIVQLRSHGWF
jgi:hypothetical protein